MEKLKINVSLTAFEHIVRLRFPFDEYEIKEIKGEWSWKHFNFIPTAYAVKRLEALHVVKAKRVIQSLKDGKTIAIGIDETTAKVLMLIVIEVQFKQEWNSNSITLTPWKK
jgi:hypothetical protein